MMYSVWSIVYAVWPLWFDGDETKASWTTCMQGVFMVHVVLCMMYGDGDARHHHGPQGYTVGY
ncbi:hypothetical protein EON63_22110 [archaeon]|nr:MAG: hypothetical protein EON63_22110 [archaeon]